MSQKIKRGWMKNEDTKVKKAFQFNPTSFKYSRGSSFVDISAPGMPYPDTQFVKGNARSFSVPLFLYDNPSTGVIEEYMDFLNSFLPPESYSSDYTRPPIMTFCYGTFIRKCVVEDLSISILRVDTDGAPLQAEITLQLRQVSI